MRWRCRRPWKKFPKYGNARSVIRIDPTMVIERPVQGNHLRRAQAVDLGILPQVVWTPSQDPGPYITAPVVITKDAETGRRNVGTYRLQMKGAQPARLIRRRARSTRRDISGNTKQAKEDMPVAIAIGVDPDRCARVHQQISLRHRRVCRRRRPARRSRCRWFVAKPSISKCRPTAEIVLEGFMRAGLPRTGRTLRRVFGLHESRRPTPGDRSYLHDPAAHAGLSFFLEPDAAQRIELHSQPEPLRRTVSPPAASARTAGARRSLHRSGGASGMLVISMKKEYPEQVKEVAWGAWSLMNKEGKFTVVVDDDIDVRNPFQVEWAMGFRAQPARDTFMVSGVVPSGVDPSTAPPDIPQHDPRRRAGSKMLIDATRKHPYPPAARVPAEYIQAAQKKWRSMVFQICRRRS